MLNASASTGGPALDKLQRQMKPSLRKIVFPMTNESIFVLRKQSSASVGVQTCIINGTHHAPRTTPARPPRALKARTVEEIPAAYRGLDVHALERRHPSTPGPPDDGGKTSG
jgi:hypothetical protein